MPKKYTYEDVKLYIESQSQSGCKLISKTYLGNKIPLIVLCNNCTNEYPVSFEHFKGNKKYKCNRCSGKHKYSIQEIREIISSESKCKLISDEYKNTNSLINLVCECSEEFSTTLKRFRLGKKQCDKCTNEYLSRVFSKGDEIFKKQLLDICGSEYVTISEYKNNGTKVYIKHNACGHCWWANPGDILYKLSGCPNCNTSKGEQEVARILTKHNVNYIPQMKFDECKNIRSLPFDFIINEQFLLEFDGIQHFSPKSFGGGEEKASQNFNQIRKNDEIKNKFCIINKIPLIRIPYWELEKVNIILDNVLGYFELKDVKSIDKSLVYKYLVNHSNWSHKKYIEHQYVSNREVV